MSAKTGSAFSTLLARLGRRLARKLRAESAGYQPYTPSDFETLCRTLLPGDVLLIEGNERISGAIKYLTQSTWSHAAVFVGDALPEPDDGSERPRLVEVLVGEGCIASSLSKYEKFNTRICRAVGLSDVDRDAVVTYMTDRLGLSYDMRNIFDLLRYFFPTPPVPVRWRRRMIAFGSGDPTRAICSSLIAQAFQSIRYPILPTVVIDSDAGDYARNEIYHIRHHSLFAPRDFDLSPFFEVVKPTLVRKFEYRKINWQDPPQVGAASAGPAASEPGGSAAD